MNPANIFAKQHDTSKMKANTKPDVVSTVAPLFEARNMDNTVKVSIKELVDISASKGTMYRALTNVGKHDTPYLNSFRPDLSTAQTHLHHRLHERNTHGHQEVFH